MMKFKEEFKKFNSQDTNTTNYESKNDNDNKPRAKLSENIDESDSNSIDSYN